ncbi:unnamed protein product, partial [Mesorhabditis belari]|uniref:Uncharacterized protein n=1 Tax=Mesorhabditis belari TaxID=2138241 RepID=A0AAF3EKG6_9BILA
MVIKLAICLLIILSVHAEDVFINTAGLRECAVKNDRMWDPISDIPCGWACMGKGCDRGGCEKRWHIVDGQKKFDSSSIPRTDDYRWLCTFRAVGRVWEKGVIGVDVRRDGTLWMDRKSSILLQFLEPMIIDGFVYAVHVMEHRGDDFT